MKNILSSSYKSSTDDNTNIPLKIKSQKPIFTSRRYLNARYDDITINASIPEVNIIDTKQLEEINKYISDISKKIVDLHEKEKNRIKSNNNGKVDNNKKITISYASYRYGNLISLGVNTIDNSSGIEKKEYKTFVYDFYSKKLLNLDDCLEYIGKSKKDIKNIAKKEMLKNGTKFDEHQFLITDKAKLLLKTKDDTFIEIE